jgi:gas vesicle protein
MGSQGNEGASFFAGLVIGGLIGAALALLLAPQSGEETRAQIRDRSLEYKDRAEEGLFEARQRATEVGHRAQVQVAALQEKGKEALEKGKQSAAEVIEKGKQSATEALEKGKQAVSRNKDGSPHEAAS